MYREGAAVTIAGRPNVGKSSLFNALLRDARAIVTAHPGTTRDLIEEIITIKGIPVRLIDTAGLRHARDEAEKIGVEVARNALLSAAVVLLVIDATDPDRAEDKSLAAELAGLETPVLAVVNKTDLEPQPGLPDWVAGLAGCCPVSAMTGEGLHELEGAIGGLLLDGAVVPPDQSMLTRVHQRDSLRRAREGLARLLGEFSGPRPSS